MRRALGTLFLLMACNSHASAELVFSEGSLDLGKVRAGQIFEQRIPLINTGAAAVEVLETKAGCTCVRADVEPRVVPGGQKANLLLRINTLSASPGQHAWRVTVKYRSGTEQHESAMLVQAQIFQEIIVEPPTIIIYSDNPTQHELRVTDLRAKPLRILKLEPTSPHLKAAVAEEAQDKEGHTVRKIGLQIGDGFAPGRHDETLTTHTDDPLYRQLQVQVSVVKRAKQRFAALPANVGLIASPSQPAPGKLVSIRDNQGQLVTIERVTADDPAISCQWSMGPNAAATVKITVERAKMLGDVLDSKVHVHLASGDRVTIPVRCDAR
jgi:uncharacterized protein DUF1573